MRKVFPNIMIGVLLLAIGAVNSIPQVALAQTPPAGINLTPVSPSAPATPTPPPTNTVPSGLTTTPSQQTATQIAQTIQKQQGSSACSLSNLVKCISYGLMDGIGGIFGVIAGQFILPIIGWVSAIAGFLLNSAVKFTIVDMAQNYGHLTVITQVWGVVRDVANMFFIFFLLYAALMTMFGRNDYQRTIKNIIIAAVLINFSLFFTKIVIDAGNLLALTVYKAIVPSSAFTDTLSSGLANAFMDKLKLSTIWKSIGTVDGTKLFTVGVMGSVVALISIFIFLAIAVMFIIRYVVLIFVLILSPIMAASLVLPNLKDPAKQWRSALMSQTFFPVIYFFLTWISLKLISAITQGTGDWSTALSATYDASGKFVTTPDSFSMLINFVIIIAFMIMSLTIARSYSNKAGKLVGDANKWASGFAGGASLGMAGRFSRGTLGRAGSAIADSERLRDLDAKGGISGRFARLTLAAGRKTSESSFDARNTGLNKTLGAGQGQGKGKGGGYALDLKDKSKREVERAKSFKTSDTVQYEAEQDLNNVKNDRLSDARAKELAKMQKKDQEQLKAELERLRKDRTDLEARGASKDELDELDKHIKFTDRNLTMAKGGLKDYAAMRVTRIKGYSEDDAKKDAAKALNINIKELNNRLNKDDEQGKQAKAVFEPLKEKIQDSAFTVRRTQYARGMEEQRTFNRKFDPMGRILGVGGVKKENIATAIAIRKEIKEKSKEAKLADQVKALMDDGEGEAAGGATPPAAAGTAPAAGGDSESPKGGEGGGSRAGAME